MKRHQPNLIWVLLPVVLAVAVLVGVLSLTGAVSFLYRNVTSLAVVHSIVQVVGYLAAGALAVTALMLVIPAALRPAKWPRKLFYMLPVLFFGIALAGVFFTLAGVGSGVFASAWLGVGAVLSAIAVLVVASRAQPDRKSLQSILLGAGLTAVLSLVGWLGMIAMLVLVSTNQPSFAPRGDFGGLPGGQGGLGGFVRPEGRGEPGRLGGFGGLGGFLGPQNLQTVLLIGAIILAVLAVLAVLLALRSWRSLRAMPVVPAMGGDPQSQTAPASGRPDLGGSLAALGVLAVIFLGAIQLVPVARANPPVETTIQWDTPQTKALAYQACMDCHSNETSWPWYATVAPGSWLTSLHVNEGRQRLNFSELNQMSARERSRLVEEIGQQIRNGSMPLSDYVMIHPQARLTDAEKQQLIQGFQNSLK